MARFYGKGKGGVKPKKKKKRKYSLRDRIKYYASKFNSGNELERAFSLGYHDSATGDVIKCPSSYNEDQADAYYKGVEKGDAARSKSYDVKF